MKYSSNKKKKANKSCDVIRKSIKKNIDINPKKQNLLSKYASSKEKIVDNIKNIQKYLLLQTPDIKQIEIVKNTFLFYKYVNKNVLSNENEQENIETPRKTMFKSNTEDNIFKKRKKIIKKREKKIDIKKK